MLVPETEIIVTKDGAEILRKTVQPGDYVIGREPGCEVQVNVELVSRRHAQLTVNFDHALIEDLGSSNGTFVNGQAIKECTRLWPNQKIQIGTATVELHRLKNVPQPDVSLAPTTAAVRRILPEEFLRHKKYDIGGVVAQGGMGAILDVKEATIERKVAMKVMLDGHSPDDLTRFIGEAKITGQLEHPNIVPVHELGVDENDQVFYTMKLVRGITLRKVLDLMATGTESTIRKYPLAALLTIFEKVCDAVAFAHSKSVIHRDLKPENFMLGDFGEVLVMDWGLAKLLSRESPTGGPTDENLRSVARPVPLEKSHFAGTLDGSIMGTPQYMAPEQARGEVDALDARADIYSLGAILFHLLYLRAPVSGGNVREIVAKVAEGHLDWPDAKAQSAKKLSHLPGGHVPESLIAVFRKALALDPCARYQGVAALQKDIAAYQAGFATSAENAGFGKQVVLLVKRHKALFSTAFAAWFIITALAGWFVINVTRAKQQAESERSRAAAEAKRAEVALADLKKTAPALRQLAESEAGFQRLESALDKLDAALALDPAHLPSYWRRAWLFIGMDRLAEAAAAIRLAQQKDPAHGDLAEILPTIEKLAALPAAGRWSTDAGRNAWNHLVKVGASGEAVALSAKLNPDANEKLKLVRQRLDDWLGRRAGLDLNKSNLLRVMLSGFAIDTIEPLRGLPIDILLINGTNVANLEPLSGMRLVHLELVNTKVIDLSPLIGMPLSDLFLGELKNVDLSPLRGLPLERIYCGGMGGPDFSPLRDAPLIFVDIGRNRTGDLNFLSKAPLQELDARDNNIVDLSPLRGKPLKKLLIAYNNVSDLSSLVGAPIEELSIHNNPLKDVTPLLKFPKLEKLRVSRLGKLLEPLRAHQSLKYITYNDEPYRAVAEFWKEYDAEQAAGKK